MPLDEGNSGYRAGRWRRDYRCTILASSLGDFACCSSTATSRGKVYYVVFVCVSLACLCACVRYVLSSFVLAGWFLSVGSQQGRAGK